ncbi:hypothetical protein GMOD_00008402 [Pyrenophora seminiperda CCB06]|uniref:Uncharacterized protein n=1 Tax=Pyrenophora seminiperda CCB06 TaxID=1302712 RepID=A0A3M7M8F0_9PLEO|nr:hypothetical protein GMOD_00008402 [Pyrenophora seminiperda CCB06]
MQVQTPMYMSSIAVQARRTAQYTTWYHFCTLIVRPLGAQLCSFRLSLTPPLPPSIQ